ncbi:MAG: SMP-30/gluconolactonase/LRE family protein [Gammaproteobacteria bacterium]
MNLLPTLSLAGATTGLCLALSAHAVSGIPQTPSGPPLATLDLTAREGVRAVKGEWRYSDTRIIEIEHRRPDKDGQPTGERIKTYDYAPHAGWIDFDDRTWSVLDPTTLSQRRCGGRLCFNWYRIKLTIPQRIGTIDPTGTTAVLETSVDDYAEIWVDGELPRASGQSGGSVISGWNAPNRLVIGRDVRPGQPIQIAIFGINGPVSDPPANFIWMRTAKLDFYPTDQPGPVAVVPQEVNVEIVMRDPALAAIVPANPKIFKLAEGFQFTEGPIWMHAGYLLFSDPNSNTIYKYVPDDHVSVFRAKSGYDGKDIAVYGQPGSNGLTLDREGRLTINEHGNHRVTRLERDGRSVVLADRHEGKRLNSPNDLVYKSDGALYFTDPPFGLPKVFDDPRKQLPYSGVYRWAEGKLQLLSTDLTGPNGIAFSPDEKYLYVGNWDLKKKVVMRYPVKADGSLEKGEVFFDMTAAPGAEALDGLKVDQNGNLYVSGPGGIWILSSAGKHLGTIKAPRLPANFAWGDEDGKTLYMTARTALYKMRLNIAGVRP